MAKKIKIIKLTAEAGSDDDPALTPDDLREFLSARPMKSNSEFS